MMDLKLLRRKFIVTKLTNVLIEFLDFGSYNRVIAHWQGWYVDKFIIAYYYKGVHLYFYIMNVKSCPKCNACFIDGVLRWAYSGKEGDPRDLAGLVCKPYGDNTCINPMKNVEGGDTWAKRCQFIEDHPFGV